MCPFIELSHHAGHSGTCTVRMADFGTPASLYRTSSTASTYSWNIPKTMDKDNWVVDFMHRECIIRKNGQDEHNERCTHWMPG